MDRSILLTAGAVVAAVVIPVALADTLAGPPGGGRGAPAPDAAERQATYIDPFPDTYVGCKSGALGDRIVVTVQGHADGNLDRAVELARLWITMVPDFPPGSDCHWECIVHGLNQSSCDPVYAPIVMPCGPEAEDHTCQSFVCEPVWDGKRMHCGYHGNVTGHTHVITDGLWARAEP